MFHFRLHLVRAHDLINNLALEPLQRNGTYAKARVCAVLSGQQADLPSMDSLIAKANALSPAMTVLPCMYAPLDWEGPAGWLTAANTLKELRKRRPAGINGTGFDFEFYAHASATRVPTLANLAACGYTRKDLENWMAPFLDVVYGERGSARILPAVHPARIGNEAQDLLLEASGGEGELWDEMTFSMPHLRRISPFTCGVYEQMCSVNRFKLQALNPKAKVVSGFDDDILRIWGLPFLNALLDAIGSEDFWVFDFIRSDGTHTGKAIWEVGHLMTTQLVNDVSNCWVHAPLSVGGMESLPGGLRLFGNTPGNVIRSLEEGRLDGLHLDPKSTGEPWMSLRAAFWPESPQAPFTVDTTVRIPKDVYDGAPLVGSCTYNVEPCQVVFRNGLAVLEVRKTQPVPGKEELVIGPASPGQKLRLQYGRDGNTWMHGPNRSTLSFTPPGVNSFYIGHGTIMGTYAVIGCPGLVAQDQTHTWSRLLTEPQRQFLDNQPPTMSKHFPWGRPLG